MKASPRTAITYTTEQNLEPQEKALSLRLIARLLSYTRPYAAKRNALLCAVMIRSVQLPLLVAVMKAVIDGPISRGDLPGTLRGMLAFGAWAALTELVFHFRQRWALELGESVIHDLRRDVFNHIQTLTASFFDRVKAGRLISRITSDAEAVRMGVQNVLFVSLVQMGQGLVAAVLMAAYSWRLFLVVLVIAPLLYLVVRYFRVRLSRTYRDVRRVSAA